MRLPIIVVAAFAIAAPAASAGPTPAPAVENFGAIAKDACRKPASYQAGPSVHRGKPEQPRKLTELPPATAFMAVYRTINGCEEPMTVIEYRTGRRP
jgi:hypothetical protein